MVSARDEAWQVFRELRRGTENYTRCLQFLRAGVEKGDFTLESLGTDDAELRTLRVKGGKTAAWRRLETLNRGTTEYRLHLQALREEVRQGGFTLADLFTSEVELEDLRVKGCKTTATYFLDLLRPGLGHYALTLDGLRRECALGRLPLAEIGTSEAELEELRIKGCKTAAQMSLDHLRRGTDRYDVFQRTIREQLRFGGLILADIGTTEEELASLRGKPIAA